MSGTPAQNFHERLISELELGVRTLNCLDTSGCRTVGDLTKLSEADLLRVPNFGRKSLNEIKEVLSSMGLRLRGSHDVLAQSHRLEALPTIPLAALSREEQLRVAGSLRLPRAKNSSEPYYYRCGPKPVPDGTPVSFWFRNPGERGYSYWVAKTSKDDDWRRPRIFRTRDTAPKGENGVIGIIQDPLTRIATALERIVVILEAE